MRKFKIGIRSQLLLLVTFASLFSLFILAVVCGVYFSNNLTDLRADRLEVISQLKTSQVTQAINYLIYQIYWMTTKDAITTPLSTSRAGNNSELVFLEAQVSLDQFLTNSETFAAARLYNLDLEIVAESFNNASSVSVPALDYLYPLQQNLSVPNGLSSLTNGISSYYFTGPVSNNSDADSVYFVGITYPVYANTSIILNQPSVAGYLSVITNANNIQAAVNDTTTTELPTDDYIVLAVQPVFASKSSLYGDGEDSASGVQELVGFQAVFPLKSGGVDTNRVYNINSSLAIKEALTKESGSSTKKKNISGDGVALGFSRLAVDTNTYWSIIIEQKLSKFNAPIQKFTNIIIGLSFGIGAFVFLITFPMTILFIRPITKLKDATEAITRSKREREKEKEMELNSQGGHMASAQDSSPPPPYYSTLIRRFNGTAGSNLKEKHGASYTKLNSKPNTLKKDNRNSVISAGTGGSGSVYSSGIRLPSRIEDSKKFFKDELTELTEAFNIMREELEKQYVHLEDRVKSRTKELEASKIEAEAANEAKTVFIANISHELRTPLNGILGMTSIAMDEDDTSRIKDSLKLINRSGELLLHILTELLTYSKNTLNRSKLEKSSFQILEIVYQVQSIFSKLANDQRVFFKILVKPNSLRRLILHGDSNRIIQVVMNLVSNSLKFTPVDGRVDVSFKLLGEYDTVRSRAANYDAVYVKGHQHAADFRPKHKHNASNNDDNCSFISSLDDDNNDNDATSIVTYSTTKYQDVVFESQFKGENKPLPTIPSEDGSNLSQHSNALPSIPADSNNGIDSSNSSGYSDLPTVPPKDDIPLSRLQTAPTKLLPPPNMRESSTTTNVSATTKRPSISSASSSLNSHEYVKDDKAYKIKNFNKSKPWVLQIEVSDTGPGIEPALQEKVFEPFIQGDQTLSRSYGGTGLGLAICRQLARMMHGTLTLKSTLGVGSTFIFTVPLPQVGEIMVPDEDMPDFCEDQFNPKARINRKVAFAFDNSPSSSTVNKTSTNGEVTDTEPKGSPFADPIAKSSPNKSKASSSTSASSRAPAPKFNIEKLGTFKPNSEDSGGSSESGQSGKRNPFYEKPHLITRSSTGTANSSNNSDRLDVGSRLLLDNLSHLKILVAEDNLVNQEVIKRMLLLEGFSNITMASNGAEAVDSVKKSIEDEDVFDLIFMDVQMPKIDGLLATRMIRSNLHFDAPIIALTAFADESNAKECLNNGMSGFLAKPIRRTNLRKIITEFSPVLLRELVTTPQTHQSDEKRLGFDSNQNKTSSNNEFHFNDGNEASNGSN